MLWFIDSCQYKISTDQYHVTISRDHRRLWSRRGTDKSSLFLYKNEWNRSTFYQNRVIFPLSCKRALKVSVKEMSRPRKNEIVAPLFFVEGQTIYHIKANRLNSLN